jgi:hypothetical protein
LLDNPFLTDVYLGTNVLPNGVEGTADDIKGELKPWCWGTVTNVELKACNTSKLIYKANQGMGSGEQIYAVYDRGVALTAGADYTDQTDMEANAPMGGEYRVLKSSGYIRLGSSPAGQITVNMVKGSSGAMRTIAQTMKAIFAYKSLIPLEADVVALDAINSREVGAYYDKEITISDALNRVSKSCGSYFYYDRTGQLRIGYFQDPAYAIVFNTLEEYQIIDIEHIPTATNKPYAKYVASWRPVETIQSDNDLAFSVSKAFSDSVKSHYRKYSYSVANAETNYNSNKVLQIVTRFYYEIGASEQVTRMLALYSKQRRCFEVKISIEFFDFEIGSAFYLSHYRFGLSQLKCLLIGYSLSLEDDTATLRLWG